MNAHDLHHLVQTAVQYANGSGDILQVAQFVLAGLFAAGGIIKLVGPQWLLGFLAPIGLGGGSPKTYGAAAIAGAVGLARPDLHVWCIAFAAVVIGLHIFTSILRRLRVFEFAFLALVLAVPPFFVSQYWTPPMPSTAASEMCIQSKARATTSASAGWKHSRWAQAPAG